MIAKKRLLIHEQGREMKLNSKRYIAEMEILFYNYIEVTKISKNPIKNIIKTHNEKIPQRKDRKRHNDHRCI